MGCHGYSSRPATWTCPCNMFQQLWQVWQVSIWCWIGCSLSFLLGHLGSKEQTFASTPEKLGPAEVYSRPRVTSEHITRFACCMVRDTTVKVMDESMVVATMSSPAMQTNCWPWQVWAQWRSEFSQPSNLDCMRSDLWRAWNCMMNDACHKKNDTLL